MKKYNKPEIEALALETLDVITLSDASQTTAAAVAGMTGSQNVVQGKVTITDITTNEWSW